MYYTNIYFNSLLAHYLNSTSLTAKKLRSIHQKPNLSKTYKNSEDYNLRNLNSDEEQDFSADDLVQTDLSSYDRRRELAVFIV